MAHDDFDLLTIGAGSGATVAIAGTTEANFAFQLMGDVSFPIFVGATLDFGYHDFDAIGRRVGF